MVNSIEENIEILEKFSSERVLYGNTVAMTLEKYKDLQLSTKHILSDYKRVLKENEELNKNYNSLTDKIILKIDKYDYNYRKAKRQNKNDIADYYWDLIRNFKKLLGGE